MYTGGREFDSARAAVREALRAQALGGELHVVTTSQVHLGAAEVHVGWREQRYAAVVMVLVVPVKIRRAEGAPVSVT